MHKIGNILGVLGIAICILSVIGRFVDEPHIFGFQAINLWTIGVGVVAIGCFAKLSGR